MSTYYSWMLLALSYCLHGDALCTLEFLRKVNTLVPQEILWMICYFFCSSECLLVINTQKILHIRQKCLTALSQVDFISWKRMKFYGFLDLYVFWQVVFTLLWLRSSVESNLWTKNTPVVSNMRRKWQTGSERWPQWRSWPNLVNKSKGFES